MEQRTYVSLRKNGAWRPIKDTSKAFLEFIPERLFQFSRFIHGWRCSANDDKGAAGAISLT